MGCVRSAVVITPGRDLSSRKTYAEQLEASAPASTFATVVAGARRRLSEELRRSSQGVVILEVDEPFWTETGADVVGLHAELRARLAAVASVVIEVGAFRFLLAGPAGDIDDASAMARAAREALGRPCQVGGRSLAPVAVAGAAFATAGDDPLATLRRAATALNEARRRGRRLLTEDEVLGGPPDLAALAQGMEDLERTIAERRLRLALQPVMDARTRKVLRHEALLRVIDRNGSVVSAAPLIAAAETLEFSGKLDLAVLDLAASALAADPNLEMAINISAASARDKVQARAWLARMEKLDGSIGRVTVELTETAAPDDAAGAISSFAEAVRRMGASFSIDDFGSGYTSYRSLMALQPDEVKIDGWFVRELRRDPRAGAFVKALVGLAREIGARTVAEWVETVEDARALTDLGADALQGIYFGEPKIRPDVGITSRARRPALGSLRLSA